MADPRVVGAALGEDPRAVAPMEHRTAEERDVEAFTSGANEFRKGARQGFNQLAGSAQALAGTVAEPLGLTDFAASRFAEAESFTKFADSVAPETRDYRQVKDFDSLVNFVNGQLGNAAANFAPAVVGGVGGALAKGGLRGAMVGLGAGSFVPNAGEQANAVHAGPGTPGEKLANSLAVGGVNTALDMVATGRVAKQIARPTLKAAGRQALGTTAAEAGTEGLQDVVGQAGQMALDPSKQYDPHATINSAIAGGIGGGGLAAAGHVASVAPGMAADGIGALKQKLNHVPDPVDEDAALAKIAADPAHKTDDDFLAAIDGVDKDKDARLGEILAHAGERATEFKDWATNPDTYERATEFAKGYVDEVKNHPAVRAAFAQAKEAKDYVKGFAEGAKGEKKSLQRTAIDLALHDAVMKLLPEGTKAALTPTERIELSGMVKHAALHAYGARDEVAGPMPGQDRKRFDYVAPTTVPYGYDGSAPGAELKRRKDGSGGPGAAIPYTNDAVRSKDGSVQEGDRQTAPVRLPAGMLKLLGKDAAAIIEAAQGVLKSGGIPFKGEPRKAVHEAVGRVRDRKSKIESIIHENMRDEYLDDPEQRKLVTEGFMRLLNATDVDPEHYRTLADKAAETGLEGQRLSESGRRIMEAAGHVFKDRPAAMRAIEAHLSNEGFAREFNLTDEEVEALDDRRDEQTQSDEPAYDDVAPKRSEDVYDDARLRTYDSEEEAMPVYRALRDRHSGYSQKETDIRYEREIAYSDDGMPEGFTGRVTLSAHDRGSQSGFDGEPGGYDRSAGKERGGFGQWEAIRDKNTSRQAGFQSGTITVTLKPREDDERGGKKVVRVSLMALTNEAVRTLDRDGDSKRYPHDVILHGLAQLMSDPRVEKIEEKYGSGELTGWDFPPDTVMGKINGRTYTWADVKKQANMSPDELQMKIMTENPVEAAQQTDGVAGKGGGLEFIEDVILPWVQKQEAKMAKLLEYEEKALERVERRFGKTEADRARMKEDADWQKADMFRGMAKTRLDRVLQTKERIYDEMDRREREGDRPLMELGSSNVDDVAEDINSRDRDPPGPRKVGEEDGLPLQTRDVRRTTNLDKRGWEQGKGRDVGTVKDDGGSTPRPRGSGFEAHELGVNPLDHRRNDTPAGTEMDAEDTARPTKADAEAGAAKVDKGRAKEEAKLARKIKRVLGKQSAIPAAGAALTAEQKQEVRDYVERVLGAKRTGVWFKNMAEAGSFAEIGGAEVLQIANLAMDPMGAARHEAAHALMARLLKSDKPAAQRILAAAGSAGVISRLRALLKDHPDALDQLKDPEERAAYMYQFWAAGELDVGPKTRSAMEYIKSFFRTIIGLWSETFTDKDNVDKAAQIFGLFDRGELSDRNTVAEVLRDKMPKTAFDRASAVLGPVWKAVEKVGFTSDGYVRSMNIAAFNEIADKMFAPLGRESAEPGFNQAKHPAKNRFMTRVSEAVGGMSEAEQRTLLEGLQDGTAKGPAADKVRALLRDVFEYMQAKGVKAVVWNPGLKDYDELDIGWVDNYFPRYYDKQYIMENLPAFLAMLSRNGVQDSVSTADNILRGAKVDPAENDDQVGLTYFAPNTQARKLSVPASELAPFLKKDLVGTLNSYVNYTVRRAEYASRFGNQGQAIAEAKEVAVKEQGATREQVEGFNKAVQAWEGSLGHDIEPGLKGVYGALTTYQNLRLLPLALFSSLVDPMGIMVRGGTAAEAFGAFARGVRGLVSEAKDDAYDLALLAGTISSSLDDHMLADAYGSQYMPDALRHVNDKFFKWNGMESWNRQMRVAATPAAMAFIVKHAQKPGDHSARYLRELNLTPADVKVVDGRLDISSQKVRDAVNQWVDGAILRPNAAIRPVWMSDPHWMLVSHLKQYTYSFQKTIIARVAHEAAHGNYSPAIALTSYVPVIIGADVLRAVLTPGGGDDDAFEKLTLGGVVARGIQRAGLVGPGQYALDSYGDLGHGKLPFASFGGPTFQQLVDIGSAAASPQGDLGHEALRAIPGYVFVK